MYTGLYAAASGSVAQEKRLGVLNNNLANAMTVGFKADQPVFRVQELPAVVGEVTPYDSVGAVITSVDPFRGRHSTQQHIMATYTDFSPGTIRETGNAFDLALEGDGFFTVETPQGPAYTRQGTFAIDGQGILVTQNGLTVQGETGPLQVGDGQVAIDATGVVRVNEVVRGRLKLVNFAQPQALEKLGATLFRAGPDLSEEAPNNLVVHQGAVESSNSHAIRLLGETIQASRAYQAYQKVIQAFDDIAGRAVNDLAQTA